MNRTCGECSMCCTLLPVKELAKGANQRCGYQSRKRGCKVHGTSAMPISCKLWSCRWLVQAETAALQRPDRSGYVLDLAPDFIRVRDNDTGAVTNIQVVQVWCDPKRRAAHRDPRLREYLSHRANEGIAAIVRYSARDAFVLFAPQFTGGAGWQEVHSEMREEEHTAAEIAAALGGEYEIVNLAERA